MGTEANRYILCVVSKEEKGNRIIEIAKGPLRVFWHAGIGFDNEGSFIAELDRIYNLKIDISAAKVKIFYMQDGEKRDVDMLYRKDSDALSDDWIEFHFQDHIDDVRFINAFIDRFNATYLTNLAVMVRKDIREGKEYKHSLNRLLTKVTSSLKSRVDLYKFIKRYESTFAKPKIENKYHCFKELSTILKEYELLDSEYVQVSLLDDDYQDSINNNGQGIVRKKKTK